MLCDLRLPGNNFDKEQMRVQLQLLDANFDVVSIWSDGYLSRERVFSVTQPGTAVALLQFIIVIPATNAIHRRDCSLCYEKLLAHHDAAGTSELSHVAARSQGMNRCTGHASSDNYSYTLGNIQRYTPITVDQTAPFQTRKI